MMIAERIRTLADCDTNELVRVKGLKESPVTARLLEMGVYVGQQLRIQYTAPFGDPMAVQVGTYVLSMRKQEAALIEVE